MACTNSAKCPGEETTSTFGDVASPRYLPPPPLSPGAYSEPFSPMRSEPLLSGSVPPSSSFGGRWPPSYHVSVSAGRLPRAGNQYLMIDHFGYMTLLWPDDCASTAIGSRRSRAMNGMFRV